ncbi:MAG TPA: SIR2 family protein, partial [Conexibacter sp.]|nr:SIR2 family protein [Conexibacter sp.]
MSDEHHHLRIKSRKIDVGASPSPADHGDAVRSWLTALVGAEHLSLLVGSGLGVGFAETARAEALDMGEVEFSIAGADAVNAHARNTAESMGRGEPNVEDQLRSALQLLAGLQVLAPADKQTVAWREQLNAILTTFAEKGLAGEASMQAALDADTPEVRRAVQLLVGFLLAFASRPPSRERLSVFTTNYDRLIELGCDLGGLRVIDRFVGTIEPVFRASRLELDMHYNPPGIRGEPRYLEGVIRLCKLHGSLDWRFENGRLGRLPLAFGGDDPTLGRDALERLMIYPNAAKDVETLLFPYAELFRDLSAALCRPNSVLTTFGYGFGDDHINRVIRDMLTLRSTHLLVISHGDPGGRIATFLENVAPEQHSVLLGP